MAGNVACYVTAGGGGVGPPAAAAAAAIATHRNYILSLVNIGYLFYRALF